MEISQQAILPPLAKDDYERLKASIAQDGQQIPILIDSNTGEVIDGKHRQRVCNELGIEPKVESRPLEPDVAARLKVVLNTARRHLTAEQKKELIAELRQAGYTQEAVAQVVGVSQSTIQRMDISITQAGIAYIPDLRYTLRATQRDEIRARTHHGEMQAKIAADFGVSQARISQIVAEPISVVIPPPEGKYRCIVIDPPWPMKKIIRDVRPKQEDYLDYPTMTIEEIRALPIPTLADEEGCHIYLWITHKFLPAALSILREWGASYQCILTWVKNVGFTPYSWMYSTEHVLFARIGALPLDRMGLRLDFSADVRGHSVKPDEFYQKVVWASPPPRLNMFARQERDGFEAWGVEL